MPDNRDDISSQSASDLQNIGAKVGLAATRGIKRLAKSGIGKKMKAMAIKVLLAILPWFLGFFAIMLIGAMIWSFIAEDRGPTGNRDQDPDQSNLTEYNPEIGAEEALYLNKTQAIIDAYYKYMSCNSYIKVVNGNRYSFSENTQDFAGLSDYFGRESNFYLSNDFIMMADETLHGKAFYYPEQIIKPVYHELNGKIAKTKPLTDRGSLIAESFSYGANATVQLSTKEKGLWDYGFGSVLSYVPMQKDKYITCRYNSFTIDVDVLVETTDSNGDPVQEWQHGSFPIISIVNGDTLESINEKINHYASEESRVSGRPSNSTILYYLGLGQRTDDCGPATASRTSSRIDIVDKEVAARDFTTSMLSAFSNKTNGSAAAVYPLNIPVINSAATFSGNIEYSHIQYETTSELEDGASRDFRAPVKTVSEGGAGWSAGCGTDSTKLVAQRSGQLHVSVPYVENEISNPWGFEYLDAYTSNYTVYVPTGAQQDRNFAARVSDEKTMGFLLDLGLLKKYIGGNYGAIGEYTSSDVEFLSKLIAAEAGPNKTDELMVGAVFMNRVVSPDFPNTMAEVLQQSGQYACWTNGSWASATPTESHIASARQVLSGEFSIPANVVFQTADPDCDGSSTTNNPDKFYINVCLINSNAPYSTHYYGCAIYDSFDADDRFGRASSSLSSAIAAQVTALANATITDTPPVQNNTPGDNIDPLYVKEPFDVLSATGLLQRVSKQNPSLSDILADWLGTSFNNIGEFFSGFFTGVDKAFGPCINLPGPYFRYYTAINPLDVRGIVYSAIAFTNSTTYSQAVASISDADDLTFLFVGKNSGFGSNTGSYQLVPGVKSIIEGFTSPTEEAYQVSAAWSAATGYVTLSIPTGVVIQSVGDAGTVTRLTSSGGLSSLEITYTAGETTYIVLYGGLTNVRLSVGDAVNRGDQVGISGEQGGGGVFRFGLTCNAKPVDPMTYFYQPEMVWVSGSGILDIALSQIGNVGGAPYRLWFYGYDQGAEWCAIFVSWCAKQAGLLDSNTLPKEASTGNYVAWLQQRGQWRSVGSGYTPQPGDIIFFDWDNDGKPNHVGLVKGYENGRLKTVEGNTGDGTSFYTRRCLERDRTGSNILGYGVY